MSGAGWYPDPYGRFEHRFFDGQRWTCRVSTGGVESTEAPVQPAVAPQVSAAPTPAPEPQPQPAAGWYHDPERPGEERFWDGAHWTDDHVPTPPSTPPAAAPKSLPAAGWYHDPERPGEERFWDGARWTDDHVPSPPVQAPAAVATRLREPTPPPPAPANEPPPERPAAPTVTESPPEPPTKTPATEPTPEPTPTPTATEAKAEDEPDTTPELTPAPEAKAEAEPDANTEPTPTPTPTATETEAESEAKVEAEPDTTPEPTPAPEAEAASEPAEDDVSTLGGEQDAPALADAGAPRARPGWYDDPEEGGKRYWDGTTWTERRASMGNTIIGLVMGGVGLFFTILALSTILTEDCESDGMQYVCDSGSVETTINIPIFAVVGPVSLLVVLGGTVAIVGWFRAGQRATPATTGTAAAVPTSDAPTPTREPPNPPASAVPSSTPSGSSEPAASASSAPPPGPAPPTVHPIPAMGVAVLEQMIETSLQGAGSDSAEQEQRRIAAVRSLGVIARQGQAAGTADGAEAAAVLLRLLDVETGYLPEFQVGGTKKTMLHAVVEQLGAAGGPPAVEPLIEFLTTQQELNAAMGEEFTGTSSGEADHPLRRSAMAEDLFKIAAKALGQLGDPRALPALTQATEECHFGMKKAAKKALRDIQAHQPA